MSGPERCSIVIIALMLLACDIAYAAPNFEACGNIPDDEITIPGGEAVLHLHASGTRNYTCSSQGGAAIIGDNQGLVLARFHPIGKENETVGFIYSNVDDAVVMSVYYPAQGLTGEAEMDTTVADPARGTSPIFQPSPRNDSIPWARWRVTPAGGTGVLENVAYVTRFDTEGGQRPEKCAPEKTTAEVPFTAAYTFYSCPTSSGLLSAARCGRSTVLLASISSILLTLFI